jgi:RNA polymerase-interacting CarD/CdnL/TRCF family regulator
VLAFYIFKQPKGEAMKIHIGDPVMHWTYGFGHVVGIEERILSDRKTLYYAVRVRDLTVWVPADDQLEIRLRPPTRPSDFKHLFAILTGTGEPLPDDRQERKTQLVERLKDGQAQSLCRVIRDLASYQLLHTLNDNDQNLMRRSREALLGEWGFALSVPAVEAESELHRMLSTGTPGEAG